MLSGSLACSYINQAGGKGRQRPRVVMRRGGRLAVGRLYTLGLAIHSMRERAMSDLPKKKAPRGEGRVGAGRECRPGDQGMMGGRRAVAIQK